METELAKLRSFISRKFPMMGSVPSLVLKLEADYLQAVELSKKFGHSAGTYAAEDSVRLFLGYNPRTMQPIKRSR